MILVARWAAGLATAVTTIPVAHGVDLIWGQIPAIITASAGFVTALGVFGVQYRRAVGDVQKRWRIAEELITLLVGEWHWHRRNWPGGDRPDRPNDSRIQDLLGLGGPSTN